MDTEHDHDQGPVSGRHEWAPAEHQTEALVAVLEDHGLIVHRPRPLSDMEISASPLGMFNQYARDPQIIIGKHVIETNFAHDVPL